MTRYVISHHLLSVVLIASACSAPSPAEKAENPVAKSAPNSSGAEQPDPQAKAEAPQIQRGAVQPPVVRKSGSNPKQALHLDVAADAKATSVTDLLIDTKLEADTIAQEQQRPAVRVIGPFAAMRRAGKRSFGFQVHG